MSSEGIHHDQVLFPFEHTEKNIEETQAVAKVDTNRQGGKLFCFVDWRRLLRVQKMSSCCFYCPPIDQTLGAYRPADP